MIALSVSVICTPDAAVSFNNTLEPLQQLWYFRVLSDDEIYLRSYEMLSLPFLVWGQPCLAPLAWPCAISLGLSDFAV